MEKRMYLLRIDDNIYTAARIQSIMEHRPLTKIIADALVIYLKEKGVEIDKYGK
jgi:hypothetical protein